MKEFHKFELLAQFYLNELNNYTYEQFIKKPSETEWSLGELYNHIIDTGCKQLEAARQCQHQPKDTTKKKNIVGKFVFTCKMIPPVKTKAPKDLAKIVFQPSSKEEVRQRMLLFIEKMRESETFVKTIPTLQKTKHPYFGFLDALEWYQHVELHFRHHLRQKKRIETVVFK